MNEELKELKQMIKALDGKVSKLEKEVEDLQLQAKAFSGELKVLKQKSR